MRILGFCNIAVRFSVYTVGRSVSSFNDLKLHKNNEIIPSEQPGADSGSEIALSWSPMRLKILHWRPEFHSWSPTFSHLATEKKGQSPVDAYLKKLISDPVISKLT